MKDSANKIRNRLEKETSPYLKQHEYNPVDWYPWNAEALEAAKIQDKPILLSIGYSSCHWCHVMAHESFEDPVTAGLMNSEYINIKVDREERPDIDEIYMEALQLISGHGGWPLTLFLTPSLKPFYGGTYFPPKPSRGLPAFSQVLTAVKKHFEENRAEVEQQSSGLCEHISTAAKKMNLKELEKNFNDLELNVNKIIDKLSSTVDDLLNQLNYAVDKGNGGFGGAPKFPQASKIFAFLMSSKNEHKNYAIHTLNRIRCGGITDQIGGGVCRYAVDSEWIVPHFEKMLYDNAQLVPLFALGGSLLSKTNPGLSCEFLKMANDIFRYLERDLKCKNTDLYFSAEDADSESVEGKFYTYTYSEILELFKINPQLQSFVLNFYKISEAGNFEGVNILTRPESSDYFNRKNLFSEKQRLELELHAQKIIFDYRKLRVRPACDYKCIMSWNALAATGILRSALFSNNQEHFSRGLNLVGAILQTFKIKNLNKGEPVSYFHSITEGIKNIPAFCDDLAFFLEACTEALFLTGNSDLLVEIIELTKIISCTFADYTLGVLYFSPSESELPVRPSKPEDNVIYSAHSALFGSIEKILTWKSFQNSNIIINKEEEKMLADLSLISISNIAELALKAPLACAKSIQNISWLKKRNFIHVQTDSGEQPSLGDLNKLTDTLINLGCTNFICGVPFAPNLNLSSLAESPGLDQNHARCIYTLCNFSGCHLPTRDISEIARALSDNFSEQ